ncbi:hypothetical protein [Microbacterium resistens]|uniref:hypothetical protein n=1 Tax=Microbacterium resistens TaxID=156977 RepID=UPI00082C5065|nr:hypothetical protein [Microbacterium resistens]
MTKRTFAAAAGAAILATALSLVAAPGAYAATQQGSAGFGSLSACQAEQRQFAQSGIRIAQNCELRSDGLYHFTYWV